MSFNIPITVPGAAKAASDVEGVEKALDRSMAAAGRARDAMGRFLKTGTEAGEATAAAADKAAAGHGRAAKAAEGHGDALSNVIHAVEAYIAIHQFEAIVDGYVEVRNKINAVSDGQDNLNGVMAETFRIAQETRSSWEELASTYQRIANAGRGLGISQRQILDLTEELAQGMRLSGSSSREAAATMAELTHAFTVGTLTGREFRVMMKDAPALMHELQVVSGHTGAEFAEMGKHGKFTAQTLIEWFSKARDTIKDKFGQTIPTLAEDLQIVKNAAEKFFGDAAVGSGVMTALANAARYVAEHFEGIAKVALSVGEALIGLFVIEKIIGLVKALTVAVAENPLGAILVAITVGISLLRQFGDELTTNEQIWTNVDGQFVTVGDHLRALWSMIKDLGAALVELVEVGWAKLTAAMSGGVDTGGIELSLRNVLLFLASFVDAAIGILKLFKDTIVNVFGGIPVVLTDLLVQAVQSIVGVVQGAINAVIGAVNKLIEAKNWINEKLTGEKALTERTNGPGAARWADAINRQYQLGSYAPDIYDATGALRPDAVREQEARIKAAQAAGIPLRGVPTLSTSYQAYAYDAPGGTDQAANLLKPVDLRFINPYEGAGKALLQKFKEDWNADLHTDTTKDMVSSFMDELDKRAHDEAAKRVQGQRGPGAISDARGLADEKPVDEKELKALEKLRNQLREILEQTNPVTAAQEKLAHAQEIVGKAVDRGLISWGEGAAALDNYGRKLADALHPHDAWVRKQIEAQAALRDTALDTEAAAKLQEYLNYAREKGIVPTDAQIRQVQHLITATHDHVEQLRAEQQILGALTDPLRQYETGLKAAGDLLERGRINAEQYGQAVDKIRAAYLQAKPGAKSFTDGLETAWLAAKQEAQDFGATVAKLAVDDFGKLSDAFVTAANGGKVAWGDMVDSMIQDLERLILKQLEVAAINAIINAATGSPVPAATADVPGVNAPVTSPGQVARAAPSSIPAPAPPGAYPYLAAPTSGGTVAIGGGGPVILQIHNHYDQSVVHAANATPQGQRTVVNTLRANRAAIIGVLGSGR